jgi:predicted Zn-dependent peptidase
MISHKKLALSNGTRVVLVPHRDTAAATLLVLFEVGSRYESPKMNGASHYIEHMMFKGTARRPRTMDISRDLDSVGADYNAFTAKDHTGYYIKLQADRLPLAVDMLGDMLYHSVYRPKDLEAERKVILEEIRMYDDNPIMLVEELMEEELYDGSPLGRRISGTERTMMGIGRDALIGYRDAYYVPARTVIAVAGQFEETTLVPLLEKTFGARPATRRPKPFASLPAAGVGAARPRFRILNKPTEQVQLAIGFPAYGFGHPDLSALAVLSTILGGTMSSRLFMAVREKKGLAYSIRSSVNPYQDVGNLSIQAGLAKERLHEALRVIMKELATMRSKPVTSEELARAKEYTKGKMMLNLEESSHLADWFARQELLKGRIETVDERLARVFAVTADDVRRVAGNVLKPRRMALALIGPYDDPAAFRKYAETL